jgi:hypothetical protein
MKTKSIIILAFFVVSIVFISCRKDNSTFVSDKMNDSDCDNTVMQIKKMQSTTDSNEYVQAEWNTDGTVKMINMNLAFSENKTVHYVYENGRVTEAILNNNINAPEPDTVVYHYNTDGKVDSMYLKVGKDDYNSSIKLTYTDGKLTKLTGYMGIAVDYYWDIETDENHNVTKAIEYSKDGSSFIKENTYTYTRDEKKNPLKDVAVYMLYLDEAYNIFQYWGNNNYTDQKYEAHTGIPVDMTTGAKFKYNEHCYPVSYMNTVFGMVVLNEDSFIYTYY